ncbi:G protein-activated inward rectifier potassium channel 3 [Hypsibius exemplaris]|uniref:G protein-activated inward rectifier potassium channel 3 n=1 Tax=Hypsibius exemplaris TaxID=2072580 RepID=A0A9X6RJY6_HYPEX|nr:G protein-activated inward rectifier potassium channel 3 [Hypsibius exemplaris]
MELKSIQLDMTEKEDYLRGWDGVQVVPIGDSLATFPRRRATETETTLQAKTGNKHQQLQSRRQPRLLYKDGAYTLIPKNIPNWFFRFANDFWNTLLDMRWISIILFFLMSNLTVWIIFAGIFYTISYAHGDFEAANQADALFEPCISFNNNGTSFAAVFLFSVETLRTIGYGPRYPTEQCGMLIFALCLSCIVSILLESILVGLLLAKTHVPQQRTQTLLFSRFATICTRDNQMCLLFRIGNVRSSLLFRIVLKAYLVYAKRTEEGEEMPFHQHEINLKIDSNGENVYLGWPMTASHIINSSSPFYHLSRKHLEKAAFELIVILEGIVESTGASIQARTSYIPREILWGQRFQSMYSLPNETDGSLGQLFDYTYFNETCPQTDMRDRSAFEMEELQDLRTESPPEVTLSSYSSVVDMRDGGGEGTGPDGAALSPSLAKAFDIPYEEIEYRNRASSFRRASLRPPLHQSTTQLLHSLLPPPTTTSEPMAHSDSESLTIHPNTGMKCIRTASAYEDVPMDSGLRLGHPSRRQSTQVSSISFSLSPPKHEPKLLQHRVSTSRPAAPMPFFQADPRPRRRRKSSEL